MKLYLFPIWFCSKRHLSLIGTNIGSFIFFHVGKERILLVVNEYDQQMLFLLLVWAYDTSVSSLMDSIMNSKVKTFEGKGVGAHSLAHNTLGVEGHVGASGWD